MFLIKIKYNISQIKKIRTSAHLVICILISSCAQVVAPGGGAKDILPPMVVKYSPDSASLNFNSKSILISFDEFVQLHDLNNQLIISPLLNKQPEITIQKKTLSIVFDRDEKLKPNTTYSINFGNAVQDLNEGNTLENFKYIFSTGNFIDSLSLNGKVENSFNHLTEKGIIVMLYSDMSDSVVYKNQPDYFAKTNPDGRFKINNIKAGKYKLVALKDANANYKYDGETESIGFVDAAIDVSENKEILISMFQEPLKKVYLKKYIHDSYGKFTFIFNQGSDSLRVQPLNNDQKGMQEYREFSKTKDTITFWIKNFIKDSLIMQVSNGNKIMDTVGFKFIKKEDALKSKRDPLKLKVVSSPNGNQGFDLGSAFSVKFNHPLSSCENPSILLKEDSIGSPKKFMGLSYQLKNETVYLLKLDTIIKVKKPGIYMALGENIFKDWKENTNYHLLILPGTFTDIFGLTNDSIKIDFKTREEKYYGSVKLNLTIPEAKGAYILQLLDEQEHIVREDNIKKSGVLTYEHLYPRKYKLKMIYDENDNGKWDTGNYILKLQSEKVIYNSELINIRSNWDADLDWNVTDDAAKTTTDSQIK